LRAPSWKDKLAAGAGGFAIRTFRLVGFAGLLTIAAVALLPGSALAASVTITGFTPIQGSIDAGGSVVTISGYGFLGAKQVYFNGIPAVSFQVGSDTTIYATMPQNATSGYITITAADGTTVSTQGVSVQGSPNGVFTVLPSWWGPGVNSSMLPTKTSSGNSTSATQAPSVTSFTPTHGKVGTKVTISGANLSGATAVKLGGAAANFKVLSPTSIAATVPKGAKTGRLSVTTSGGTVSSVEKFAVT
jgi:hypothetical protein